MLLQRGLLPAGADAKKWEAVAFGVAGVVAGGVCDAVDFMEAVREEGDAHASERSRAVSLPERSAGLHERLLRMPDAVETESAGSAVPRVALGGALAGMVRRPLVLLRDWNWKAAAFSAILRALMFLVINLRAGSGRAVRAMLVEAVYATVAAGFAGAVTQRLRHAVPRWATALVVWLGLPLVLLAGQWAVHHAMGTPRLRAGLIASFVFAAFATGFNWFAMGRGAFVTGARRSFVKDLLLVPRLLWEFVTAPLR